jgi:stage V sporulation protein AD
MQSKIRGKQTIAFESPPVVLSSATVVGPMEGAGPLASKFHTVLADTLDGEKSWERTESKMLKDAIKSTITQANLMEADINFLLAGDLLNQITASNYAARDLPISFLGIYGACSNMALSLFLGSALIDGGFAERVVAAASSHHDTAERQYRFPTEQGVQRPLTAQWTVTGAGATLLSRQGTGVKITYATPGKVIDLGVSDPNNMGAAMAPAVADTIIRHFQDLGSTPADYDLIISGDLGQIGLNITKDLVAQGGYQLNNYTDCGLLMYDDTQDAHSGGSGCGCSAVVINAHILRELQAKRLKKVLFIGSGALLSPTLTQQGESIPSIGHAVVLEAPL